MKDKIFLTCYILMIAAGAMLSCNSSSNNKVAITQRGSMQDSSQMKVEVREKPEDGLTELVVTIETQKKGLRAQSAELLFGMQQNFELVIDTVVYMPVFFQPVAGGVENKYIYLLSFETGESLKNSSLVLRLLPNRLIGTTVNYKLE